MKTADLLARWWIAVEEATIQSDDTTVSVRLEGAPEDASSLADAAVAEVRFDLDGATTALASTGELSTPWDQVARLIELKLQFRGSRGDRDSLEQLQSAVEDLISQLPEDQLATRARARHLGAAILLQMNCAGDALEQMASALEELQEGPARFWFLDSIAQAYLSLGAWSEGRRTLRSSILAKDKVDDHLGIAISTGHLALSELQGGNPRKALEVLDETWKRRSSSLVALSRLRLTTFQLQAALDLEDVQEVGARRERLDGIIDECQGVEHYLMGFAHLARARARVMEGDGDGALSDFDLASDRLQHPELALLIDYWRIKLLPRQQRGDGWMDSMTAAIEKIDKVSESEILCRLLFAEEEMQEGNRPAAVQHLDDAYSRAVQANHPGWQEQVGRLFSDIDPGLHSRRTIERFSGRPAEEMEKTTTEDATIIFADLAGFTKRSTELEAEEVMETVRSVFELAVPLLALHKVRPLQHLGDGLLAACQGDDHRRRGFRFALDLVRRTSVASRIRRAQGEEWGLDLRAGVNSGPVVFGLLGSSFKQEWLAIGKTTNLAARLQSKGEIGEVVTLPEIAEQVGYDYSGDLLEDHEMKGFSAPVPLLRIDVEKMP